MASSNQTMVLPQLQSTYEWFYEHGIASHADLSAPPRYFLSPTQVRAYFDHRRLRSILEVVWPRRDDCGRVASKIVDHGYTLVFLTLLVIKQPEFIENFLRHDELGDQYLPYETRPNKFPPLVKFAEFHATQQSFSAPRFRRDFDADFATARVLPFEEKKLVARGGSADVYRIRISSDFDDLNSDAQTECPHVYALKAFNGTDAEAEKNCKKEMAAYNKLQLMHQVDSLARCYGTFTQDGKSYMILEYAQYGTLDQFLRTNKPPTRPEDRHLFYLGLLELCQALERIRAANGFHQDIHPLNIVVTKKRSATAWEYHFKLVDFGNSHFDAGALTTADILCRDTYGTKEYGAPEAHRLDLFDQRSPKFVTQKVDVFSLGCVFLEVALWVVAGWEEVHRFRRDRQIQAKRAGIEDLACFHNGVELLDCTNQAIDAIIALDDTADNVTKRFCNLLIKKMLENDVAYRLRADDLWPRARQIIPQTQAKEEQPPTNLSRLQISDRSNQGRRETSPGATRPPITWNTTRPLSDPVTPQTTRSTRPPEYSSTSTGPPAPPWSPPLNGQNRNFPPFSDTTSRAYTLPDNYEELFRNGGFSRSNTQRRVPAQHPPIIPFERRSQDNPPQLVQEPESMDAPVPSHDRPPTYSVVPRLSVGAAFHWKSQLELGNSRVMLSDARECKAKLRQRDHVFILDNTYNTAEHWSDMCGLLSLLSSIVEDCDDDGPELHFTTSPNYVKSQDTRELCTLANRTVPNGYSDMEKTLQKIIEKHEDKLRRAHRHGEAASVTPQSIYIFTNGLWDQGEPEAIFLHLGNLLEELNLNRMEIGIQFISFGNSPIGLRRLKLLDNMWKAFGEKLDIVDTEPSNGNVWKMLLGAIDDVYDQAEAP